MRCGHRLSREDADTPRGKARRASFAAAPHEHAWAPHIGSTLFPQLPRADANVFTAALALGLTAVCVLAIFRLYPLALLVAAVLLPVLLVSYMYAVNVYESKPGLALAVTIGWGVLVGIGLGFYARHIGIDFDGHGFRHLGDAAIVKRVFVLPIAAFIAATIAVVVLYLAPRYDEVLDGIAFGATVAVTIAAAQTVVQAATLLHDGFRAPGEFSSWLIRLTEIALLIPLSWIGGAGLMAAALWLRGRVPLRDQARVGVFANPFVIAVVGLVFFILPELVVQGFRRSVAFVILIGVAVVALFLLRVATHLALLEEADLVDADDNEITCANCHRTTPRDLFCGRCGIALRALPKARVGAGT